MSGSNPLSPNLMSPRERREALCKILALGLIRLKQRNASQLFGCTGESSLHFPPDQSGSHHATHWRTA